MINHDHQMEYTLQLFTHCDQNRNKLNWPLCVASYESSFPTKGYFKSLIHTGNKYTPGVDVGIFFSLEASCFLTG